jgi:hypothetical protein
MFPGIASEADYEVLGLKADAKPAEVKRAYRSLAKKWHPDRFHSQSYESRATAEEKFRKINEAYVRISSEWEHPAFDASPLQEEDRAGAAPDRPPEERPPVAPARSRSGRRLRNALAAAVSVAAILAVLAFFIHPVGESEAPSRREVVSEKWAENTAPPVAAPQPPPVKENLLLPAVPVPPPDLLPAPSRGPSGSYFTIGSSKSEVRRIQGEPSRIQGQICVYGLCEVRFKNGAVWRYNNFDGSLRVRMEPRGVPEGAAPGYITIGSTEDEVLQVQGTPTRVEPDRWYYGFAEIRFRDGRVSGYDNYFGAIKVQVAPANGGPAARNRFFTIGSTENEVLEVQGTPTSVAGNVWSYGFSYVFFRDGKVRQVSDAEGKLRFVPPEDRADAPAR